MAIDIAGLTISTGALVGGTTVASGVGGYLVHTAVQRRNRDSGTTTLQQLRATLTGSHDVALVVPENPSIDAIAAAMGLRVLCKEWGVTARLFAEGPVTSDDAKAFCNLFDLKLADLDDGLERHDRVLVVGGSGPVPTFGNQPPIAAVDSDEEGSTSTMVANLLENADVTPDQDVATALHHGIRAGTQEFRRVRGSPDYDAASFLHAYADTGRLDALRAPGMSGDTFDVLGEAITNRERRASFAVTNVGQIPNLSALEEAANTLLRLDGVSSGAAFGVHDNTVVVTCRAEDVRLSALDVLESAFDRQEALGGDADAATARVQLGLFNQVGDDHQETLDSLIDASARRALFDAFEQA
jgi:nanoRNase/pAp phosphatase (c-di-AMP/oligoRNAs hydrolase)